MPAAPNLKRARLFPARATHIPANDRALRERLCRYISRPPLAQGRLSLTDDGGVLWKLHSPLSQVTDSAS
ncbi:MAG: hypothetical protein GY930_04820 [bacterium]|nr:hypothetical protein [bacterium]